MLCYIACGDLLHADVNVMTRKYAIMIGCLHGNQNYKWILGPNHSCAGIPPAKQLYVEIM